MRWGRIFRIGFVIVACISLLINAVMLGIGLKLSSQGPVGGGIALAMAMAPSEMSRETRRRYVDALRAERPYLRGLLDDLVAQRDVVMDLASAQPVDKAALAAAMEKFRAATLRLQTAAHETILGSIE